MRHRHFAILILLSLLLKLSCQLVTSPWYIKNEWNAAFTNSGTVIIDSVSNGTHLFILNSWFVLYVVAYSSNGFTQVGTYDLSASAGLEVCCGNFDHSR
ncbi:hypothetical protein BKA69DRAFT_464352 [Paraphysoderma sedebokerense]|nr:hypothetical protein BKA69DRAFT_464352 [Paraphysoderma sedebokerense]